MDQPPGFAHPGEFPRGRGLWADLGGCGSTLGHSQDTYVLEPSAGGEITVPWIGHLE